MKVKNTTLVITDPCYIKHSPDATKYIDKSTIYGDWSCYCYKYSKEEAEKKATEWSNFYFDFFNKYNFSNLSKEKKDSLRQEFEEKLNIFIKENCYGQFCADSGRVAVYNYDTLSEKDQEWIKNHDWCACVIPNYSGEFEYVIEGSRENRAAHIAGDGFYTSQSGL